VAADVGQAQVEQDQVETQLRQVGDRLAAGGRGDQLVAAAAQQFVQRRQQARFVVDQQQARLFRCRLGDRGLRRKRSWGG
jgi:hypothetical protein